MLLCRRAFPDGGGARKPEWRWSYSIAWDPLHRRRDGSKGRGTARSSRPGDDRGICRYPRARDSWWVEKFPNCAQLNKDRGRWRARDIRRTNWWCGRGDRIRALREWLARGRKRRCAALGPVYRNGRRNRAVAVSERAYSRRGSLDRR